MPAGLSVPARRVKVNTNQCNPASGVRAEMFGPALAEQADGTINVLLLNLNFLARGVVLR